MSLDYWPWRRSTLWVPSRLLFSVWTALYSQASSAMKSVSPWAVSPKPCSLLITPSTSHVTSLPHVFDRLLTLTRSGWAATSGNTAPYSNYPPCVGAWQISSKARMWNFLSALIIDNLNQLLLASWSEIWPLIKSRQTIEISKVKHSLNPCLTSFMWSVCACFF